MVSMKVAGMVGGVLVGGYLLGRVTKSKKKQPLLMIEAPPPKDEESKKDETKKDESKKDEPKKDESKPEESKPEEIHDDEDESDEQDERKDLLTYVKEMSMFHLDGQETINKDQLKALNERVNQDLPFGLATDASLNFLYRGFNSQPVDDDDIKKTKDGETVYPTYYVVRILSTTIADDIFEMSPKMLQRDAMLTSEEWDVLLVAIQEKLNESKKAD
mmetsp:Transcript_44783/g.116193  ORF Transcript_44783/g.116193 Transcript_44783/m.116193 type:complete len:217 (-) Transcript_44783:25-675(-)